jgi:hypothetical protein
MNVLILTPDAVGSTLLQRLITIYMQFHEFDEPVINLHELTNGLIKYHSPEFNREILGKGSGDQWGYHQSLNEIIALLRDTEHYKTSRLAHYHIRNRKDRIEDQIPFYRYLDDNFFVIACRRQNVFEHALSWCLTKVTKKLNVYSAQEKIDVFLDIYRNQITVDTDVLLRTLQNYRYYLDWSDDHFNVGSYFHYERDLPRMEQYILGLPIFASNQRKITWHDTFGIEFDDWNRYHFYRSDIGSLAMSDPQRLQNLTMPLASDAALLEHYYKIADPSWPQINSVEQYQQLPLPLREECENQHGLSIKHEFFSQRSDFMNQHRQTYLSAEQSIEQMRTLGILTSGVPIKKQTLAEKKFMIKNFDQCIDIYNDWCEDHPGIATPITRDALQQSMSAERRNWGLTTENLLTKEQ